MEEKIEFVELEKSLLRLRQLTEKMNHALTSMDILIKDNINTGVGIWDSEQAALFREKWELLSQDFPDIMNTFQHQQSNLDLFITNMKKTEEE